MARVWLSEWDKCKYELLLKYLQTKSLSGHRWLHPPGGWGGVSACFGSKALGPWGSAACWAPVSLGLDNGMGEGKKCLGKPLKNQAPDLFHTWENKQNGCCGDPKKRVSALICPLVWSPHLSLLSADLAEPHSAWPTATLRATLGTHVLDNRGEHRFQAACHLQWYHKHTAHKPWPFVFSQVRIAADEWAGFCLDIIGKHTTYLFAVLTHHWADPRCAKLLATQHTAGHSIPTHSLLHVVQAVYQTPAAAQGDVLLKMSQLIIQCPNSCISMVWTVQYFPMSHPIRSCSMASIFSARAITPFIISFSSSVKSGPGPGPGPEPGPGPGPGPWPGCMVLLLLWAKHVLQLIIHCWQYWYDIMIWYPITRPFYIQCLNKYRLCPVYSGWTGHIYQWVYDKHVAEQIHTKRRETWEGLSRSLSTYCSLSLCHRSHIRGMQVKQRISV